MSSAAVIFLCAAILLCGLVRKVPVFQTFTKGAEEGFRSAVSVLPSLVGLMAMTAVFRASGLAAKLSELLLPLVEGTRFPPELLPLAVLRPISGSGSLALYQSLLSEHGADSLIGRLGGIIQGSGETVFYVAALYFGKEGGRNIGVAVLCAIAGNLLGIAAATALMEKFF